MQAELLVADAHPAGFQTDVFQYRRTVVRREGEIPLHQSRTFGRAGDFLRGHPPQGHLSGIVHDTLELFHGFQKTGGGVPVRNLTGQDMPTAERAEVTPATAALAGRFRQVKITAVAQIRTFVEMAFVTFRKETLPIPVEIGTVGLFHKPVLLAHHRIVGKHADGFHPGRMDSLVFIARHRIDFRQQHLKGHGQVGVLAYNAAVFHCQKGELAFQRLGFQYISHGFLLLVSNRNSLLR